MDKWTEESFIEIGLKMLPDNKSYLKLGLQIYDDFDLLIKK